MVQRETDRRGWLRSGAILIVASLALTRATITASEAAPQQSAPVTAHISFVESAVEEPTTDGVDVTTAVPATGSQPVQVTAIGVRAAVPQPPQNASATDAPPLDVLILVDTSASQAGVYRRRSLDTVSSILSFARPQDRFAVAAIDVRCDPLTAGFEPAGSDQLASGLEALERRTPLGSTDLVGGLEDAVALFDVHQSRGRRIIYVGDGPGLTGTAPVPFTRMLDRLRGDQVGFLAAAVGPMVNWPCLSAIANASGGMLVLPDDAESAEQIAQTVSRMTAEPISWPAESFLSSVIPVTNGNDTTATDAVAKAPIVLPPLRRDRDSVAFLIGPVEGMRLATAVRQEGVAGGSPAALVLEIPSATPKSDNAYLIELARNAWSTGGVFLPTLGREGLERAKASIRGEAAALAALGQQAEAAGDRQAARHLAQASLRRDPDNPVATVLRNVSQVSGSADAVTMQLPPPDDVPPPVAADDPLGSDGDASVEFERMRRVATQALEQETAVRLRNARRLMQTDPQAARDDLKALLLEIDAEFTDARLAADTRDRLARQIEMRIREADMRARRKAERDLIAQREEAGRRERLALLGDLERKQDRLTRLAARYDALVKEGIRYGYEQPTTNFVEAEREVARQFGEEAPRLPTDLVVPMNARPLSETMPLVARILDYDTENKRLRRDMERSFMDCMHLVDVASIPFPDEPPVLYPSAARWREITRLREKYKAVDLAKPGTSEEKIYQALEQPVENFDFVETPLRDVIAQIEDAHGIQVELDTRALEDFGVDIDTPVTKSLSGISLRSALRLILKEIDLAYVIKDEVMLITTAEEAENNLVLKVYPVADLVIPVNPSSGVNPFQTGGGMGGMGGMNSGMGMGGMGGMGGGMGGMGGGMFQVADARSRQPRVADAGVTTERAIDAVAGEASERQSSSSRGLPDAVLNAADLSEAVRSYLGPASPGGDAADESASAARLRERQKELRLSAAALGRAGQFDRAADLLSAAIASGHAEPWMYESLAVALEAAGRPASEVERALLSSADFASGTTDLFSLAQYMARFGFRQRSLDLCRQVVILDPWHREAFAMAMSLAEKENDVEALAWSCSGVLRHDWPADQKELELRAARLARATIRTLEEAAKDQDATFFRSVIDEALVRDVEFTISWNGEADVDLIVEEPSGGVCSAISPVSTSGATLLADEDGEAGSETHRERYVAAEAFPGTYRLLVRRVWGDVAADTVTAEMVLHRGTNREERLRRQLVIGGDDLLLEVHVPEGRRREPIEDARVARIVNEQAEVGRAVLAQQLNALADPSAEYSLSQSRTATATGPAVTPPFGQGGVAGYQPIISTLPDGTNLSAIAVVSADRRYVRVTPTPLFSGVGQVTQFNFAGGGAQGTGGMGGMGGGMGGMGGMGGGMGGMGGMGGGMGGMGGMGGGMGGMGGMGGGRGGMGMGGMGGGMGGMGGGMGGFCWVAREVYGADNPKWLAFRKWLLTSAPSWLVDLYGTHGEAFAAWIHDKPTVKAMLRWTMDQAID